jgi:HrpA-like RNA helicase
LPQQCVAYSMSNEPPDPIKSLCGHRCDTLAKPGRDAPGKAFRLYTEAAFRQLARETVPEIRRCNLASTVLQLKALGVPDVLGFDFLDPPPQPALLRSLELLCVS